MKYSIDFERVEIEILAGFLEHAIKQGVPSLTDAFNAVALHQKLFKVLPKDENKDIKGGQ